MPADLSHVVTGDTTDKTYPAGSTIERVTLVETVVDKVTGKATVTPYRYRYPVGADGKPLWNFGERLPAEAADLNDPVLNKVFAAALADAEANTQALKDAKAALAQAKTEATEAAAAAEAKRVEDVSAVQAQLRAVQAKLDALKNPPVPALTPREALSKASNELIDAALKANDWRSLGEVMFALQRPNPYHAYAQEFQDWLLDVVYPALDRADADGLTPEAFKASVPAFLDTDPATQAAVTPET